MKLCLGKNWLSGRNSSSTCNFTWPNFTVYVCFSHDTSAKIQNLFHHSINHNVDKRESKNHPYRAEQLLTTSKSSLQLITDDINDRLSFFILAQRKTYTHFSFSFFLLSHSIFVRAKLMAYSNVTTSNKLSETLF